MKKSELISLRLKEEDLVFLSKLSGDYGATTSEKIRTLIKNAKEKDESTGDMASVIDYNSKLFENAKRSLTRAMLEHGEKSEIFDLVYDWLITVASIYQSYEFKNTLKDKKSLEETEKKVIDEIFYLNDRVLRIPMGQLSRVINYRYFLDKIKSLSELVQIVENTQKKGH